MKAIIRTDAEIDAGLELTPDEIAHNLQVISNSVVALFMQRTDYDQAEGTDGEILNEGEYALRMLQRAFPYIGD